MAGHFLLSPAARNLTPHQVGKMKEQQAHNYFARMRWGTEGTQVCPRCKREDRHYFLKERMQWACRNIECKYMFSVTSGTIFASHKIKLQKLLLAIVIFAQAAKGISAVQLSKHIGVSYLTARLLVMKLREALLRQRDSSEMSGHVQVDGAHLSGRPRKGRSRSRPDAAGEHRDKIPVSSNVLHPNRRIVMVLREIFPDGTGVGARRTIVEIVMAENKTVLRDLAHKYIASGSTVCTDEGQGFTDYAIRYTHKTVNHSKEFSTEDGVSNNHAESYFSRMRRLVIGQVHRVTPTYMLDYVNEVAWREDTRRFSSRQLVDDLLTKALKTPVSPWWCGYFQGNHRETELLFHFHG